MKIKRQFFLIGIMLFTVDVHAQSKRDTLDRPIVKDSLFRVELDPSVWQFDSVSVQCNCQFTEEGAKRDIDSNNIRILFPGGFGGMPDFDNDKDKKFQEKYNVSFYSQGCIKCATDDEAAYNKIIFAFLDSKYGTIWRKEINQNALGLN